MDNSSLQGQEVWDERYETIPLKLPRKMNMIRQFMERHLPRVKEGSKSCLEVGCFPGGYLALMGDRGYRLNGFDLTERIGELGGWLEARGYIVGEIVQEDFFNAEIDKYQSDVVFSHGFIEHFEDWDRVVKRHVDFVRPGGTMLLTTPNFLGGVQQFLHKTFDAKNLQRHYLPSMSPEKWNHLMDQFGMEVRWSGYFGGFNFWVEEESRNMMERSAVAALRLLRIPLRALPDHPSYSPYCGIVAKKPLSV